MGWGERDRFRDTRSGAGSGPAPIEEVGLLNSAALGGSFPLVAVGS